MRVVLVNRFYWPDESATAMLATDLAEHLAASGHEVEAVCSRGWYRPSEARLPRRETRNGVSIRRLWAPRPRNRTTGRRVYDFAAFHAGLRWVGPLRARADATLVLSDPPLLTSAGLWIRALRGGRLFHLVFDLYPDLAISLGTLPARSPWVCWLQRRSDAWLRRCDGVFVLSELMGDRLQGKGVARARTVVTPPWADGDWLHPIPHADNPMRRSLGLQDDDCLVAYAGNLGLVHPFATVLAGLRELQGEPGLHWLFAGGGAHREQLEAEVLRLGLPRVTFLPSQPRQRLAELLSAGDIHLVTQDPRTVGLCLPSKLAAILAVQRPLLFVGPDDAEIAVAVRHFGCGTVVSHGDVHGFCVAVRELAAAPPRRREMGRAGGQGFREEFSGRVVMERIRSSLEAACREG